jgi:hypothetical protein
MTLTIREAGADLTITPAYIGNNMVVCATSWRVLATTAPTRYVLCPIPTPRRSMSNTEPNEWVWCRRSPRAGNFRCCGCRCRGGV